MRIDVQVRISAEQSDQIGAGPYSHGDLNFNQSFNFKQLTFDGMAAIMSRFHDLFLTIRRELTGKKEF